jgi:hypothetical protein
MYYSREHIKKLAAWSPKPPVSMEGFAERYAIMFRNKFAYIYNPLRPNSSFWATIGRNIPDKVDFHGSVVNCCGYHIWKKDTEKSHITAVEDVIKKAIKEISDLEKARRFLRDSGNIKEHIEVLMQKRNSKSSVAVPLREDEEIYVDLCLALYEHDNIINRIQNNYEFFLNMVKLEKDMTKNIRDLTQDGEGNFKEYVVTGYPHGPCHSPPEPKKPWYRKFLNTIFRRNRKEEIEFDEYYA